MSLLQTKGLNNELKLENDKIKQKVLALALIGFLYTRR